MIDKIIGILAPHLCLACQKEGALLCSTCMNDAIPRLPDRCYRCMRLSQDSQVCKSCRTKTVLKYVWPRAQYADTAKELVYCLKFGRAKAAAGTLAALLDEAVPFLPGDTVVTYIPTATSRVRFRGYDQSRIIAQAFARKRGLALQPLLIRIGQKRQVGANRKHRFEQARLNYRLKKCDVRGKRIILIDDILTTGATLESAASLLKAAGAKQVSAAVFAQRQ